MKKQERHYKEVIRSKVLSFRLSDEEFLRLKANSLQARTSMSRLTRDRVAELISGTPLSEMTTREAGTAPAGQGEMALIKPV